MCRSKVLIMTVIIAGILSACSSTQQSGHRITEPPADSVTTTEPIKADTPEARNLPYPGPELDILVIFRGGGDSSTLERVTGNAETVDEYVIIDKLIEYGVLDEGTEILSFEITEESDPNAETESSGPLAGGSSTRIGHLDLSALPETSDEASEKVLLSCIAGSFMENYALDGLELSINGEMYSDSPLTMDMKYKNVTEE